MRKLINLYVLLVIAWAPAISGAVQLNALDKCLNVPSNLTRDCVNRAMPYKTIDKCYTLADSIYSSHSKENVKNHCFYGISQFPTLKSCVDSAKKFTEAENKDQALFECVRQFSSAISENSCLDVAKVMTYAEKRSYLESHCRNL